MSLKSNEQLLRHCEQQTRAAAVELMPLVQAIDSGEDLATGPACLPNLTRIRNHLRAAYCAAQELKQRAKKLTR